ncbi:MAG: hypothetical protein COT71_00270 [Candidatus Andersenbacteria bacterium CG10_big_fil_rev_8_21_14_0_10_54_11]|uniref:Uncharacterized protein n=1 Tax=Candidatus Andersenbacteria bacterium CG10_big_fil_rev_8_21_14_0_10_54_11 TaxID=1974485 RepID=A0A2M6X0K0_9BACT|nr:MAG: hypothetical protein COT71_00270 [Candidatus Andersenbacteria bacterium CG10_big_fil_rev_8_21_14_0_10_54_11]
MQQSRAGRSFLFIAIQSVVRRSLQRVAVAAAAPLPRVLLLLVFLILLGWLMYQSVWQQLSAPAPLPAGVSAEDPQLNTNLLRTIAAQREERVRRPRLQWEALSPVITASVESPLR